MALDIQEFIEKAAHEPAFEAIRIEIEELLGYFADGHLPEELAQVSRPFGLLAQSVAQTNMRSFQTVASLNHLLEAKDCAVRAMLAPAAAASEVVVTGGPAQAPKHKKRGIGHSLRRPDLDVTGPQSPDLEPFRHEPPPELIPIEEQVEPPGPGEGENDETGGEGS